MAQPNWIKTDKGTIEDPDNDLMWAVKIRGKNWVNGLIGMKEWPMSKRVTNKIIWVTTIGDSRVKVKYVPFFKNQDPYREMFLNLPKKPARRVSNYQAGGETSVWTSETRYDSYAWKCYFPDLKEICVDQSVSTTGTSVRMVRDLD